MYPVAFEMVRQAARDDIIPLFSPLVTEDGRTVKEIPIARGTILDISVIGYNT